MPLILPLLLLLSTSPLSWSDPVPIARTTVAAPPAVAVLHDRAHVLWLDRKTPSSSGGEIWHAVLAPDGRLLRSPARLRSGVDLRLAFPVAVPWGESVAAAWMARGPAGVILEIAVLDGEGGLRRILRPDPTPREEGGRIALGVSADGRLHAAWSQFDGATRRIWYARLDSTDDADVRAAPLVAGDAPALLLHPVSRLFWWEGLGSSTFRLLTARLAMDVLGPPRPLTGTLSLAAPLPVLPAAGPRGTVVLIPTLERAFATAGRLYGMRPADGDGIPSRLPLLAQSRISDVSLAEDGDGAVVIWSQAIGRRQNSEIHAARLDGDDALLAPPSRLTYTIAGSLRPAGSIVGGHAAAVWLEVTGFGEFSVVFGTSAAPRRHRFLLGITELDLYRPGTLFAFGALTLGSVLPFAALVTATTMLPALLLLFVMQPLAAPFGHLERAMRSPLLRLGLVLAVVLVLQIAGKGLLPGRPTPALIAAALAVASLVLFVLLRRQGWWTSAWALLAAAIVFVQSLIVLFPWGAVQLSQF